MSTVYVLRANGNVNRIPSNCKYLPRLWRLPLKNRRRAIASTSLVPLAEQREDHSLTKVKAEVNTHSELYSMVLSYGFLNSLSTGYLLFDADGEIIDCNKAAARLLGTERDELMGRNWYESKSGAVHEDGSPFSSDEQPAMVTLRSGEPMADVIIGVDNPGAARRWLLISTYPLISEGQSKGVIASFVDLTERVRREHARQLLLEVNRFVMFSSDGGDPLQHLCDALVKYGPYAIAGVAVASSNRESGFELICGATQTEELYEEMASSPGSKVSGLGAIGSALRTRVTQVVHDLNEHPGPKSLVKQALQHGLGSVIAIPFDSGRSPAVLGIFARGAFTFDETTVQELEAIAKECEFSIAHIRSVAELAAALQGTLGVLAEMTETRDPYTAGHQTHVGSLGEAIAIQLGLDHKMVTLIRQAGEVHDVGKIAIPSEILTKPGRLSPLEFEMVKTHATIGFNILTKASLPWPIAEVALQHHERLDASGYPAGLRGNEIILPARIIAIADVVEAMTQHRPYRPALGLDVALAEVRRGAGTIYDADVVNACVAVFEADFTFGAVPDANTTLLNG